jgi:hypothetical protein
MRPTRVLDVRRALTLTCAFAGALLSLFAPLTPAAPARQKLKAEEVLAKHLDSIGPAAARSGLQTVVIAGTSKAVFKARNNIGAIDGQLVLASKENKSVIGMAFPSTDYSNEKFGYDGKKFTVGYLKPGVRSTLGSFLLTNDEPFKEGLMGGTLSAAWPLLNLSERKAKLEYSGTDKVDGRPAHKLRYSPSKGSDLTIHLFFDAETFRHVRTQYDRVAGARLSTGGIDAQASQRAPRYRMTEDFSDFKQEGNLTFPHSYKLTLELENTAGTSVHTWEMALVQFAFNEALDDTGFDVDGK